MITMKQVSATVDKGWVRIGIYRDQQLIEFTINGATLNMPCDNYDDTILALKEAVANL